MSDLVDVLRKRLSTVAHMLAEDGPSEFQAAAREYGHENALEWFESLEAENAELRARVSELEAQVDALTDIGTEKSTKEEKIAAIVVWAQRQATNAETDRVAVTARDIRGATGVSRRYAYDLIDELPDRHEWLLDRDSISQYGDLELDQDSRSRALVVDLELLHTDAGAVNKFTTRTARNGVEA